MRRVLVCVFAFFSIAAVRADAQGCCGVGTPRSMLDNFLGAEIVTVGRFQNAVGPNNALPNGQTELTLEDVLLPHASIKERKSIFFPYKVDRGNEKFVVAIDIYKGNFDPFAGVVVDPQGEVVRFVRGAMQLKDKSPLARARYAVDFVHSPNKEIAESAQIELARLRYADLRKIAEELPPGSFAKALQDRATPIGSLGTYAMLLGHCGKKEHAALLRKLIDENLKQSSSILDGMLFGHVLLDPDDGWRLVLRLIEKKDSPFLTRYSALKTVRLLYEERKDVIAASKSLDAIARFLGQTDMADFVIEDLRRWQRWEHCEAVLELDGKDGFQSAIVRRAVLRFALQCPNQACKNFVNRERLRDPEWVSDAEEVLALQKDLDDLPKK